MPNRRDVNIDLIGHDHTGHATRSAAGNLDQLKRKLHKFNVAAVDDAVEAGTESAVGFLKSFSTAFRSIGNFAMPILVASLLKTAFTALQAGLPLLLAGGILAVPILNLVKDNAKAVDKVKKKWGEFKDYISQPLKVAFLDSLESIKTGLENLKAPFGDLVSDLAPLLKPFTDSVMTAIHDFVVGIKPSMPGVTAGISTLSQKLPTVATALSDMINSLLKDPAQVEASVNSITSFMVMAVKLGTLTAQAFNFMTHGVGKFANGLALGGLAAIGFQHAWHAVTRAIARAGLWIQGKWNAMIAFVKRLPGRAGQAISGLWRAMKRFFDDAVSGAGRRARSIVDAAKRGLSKIKGAAAAAVRGLWGAMKGAFQTALDGVTGFASKIAEQVREIIGLKAKASGNVGGSNGGSSSFSAGASWSPSLGGTSRVAMASPSVSVAAPIVDVRNFIDGRQFDSRMRSTVIDENKRAAWRARVGAR